MNRRKKVGKLGRLDTRIGLALAAAALLLLACSDRQPVAEAPAAEAFAWPAAPERIAVLSVAGFGEIELELHASLAPKTVANFEKLAGEGFYDDTTFHRVIPGFMIQGGDPNTKDKDPTDDGMGGPGYTIDDEPNPAPHTRGTLSMANVGRPDSGGSQFFIVTGEARHLDTKHTVFGRVRAGMEVADAIEKVDVDLHGRWGPKARPIESVVVERVEIRTP